MEEDNATNNGSTPLNIVVSAESGEFFIDKVISEEPSASIDGTQNTVSATLYKTSQTHGQTIASVYRHDVICHPSENGLYGLVSKVAGDSDSESDEEEEDETESLPRGHARVFWSNMTETEENIENLQVVDRNFLHGDIVAAIADPIGQTGTVINVELMVDLKMPNGDIMANIPSRKIGQLRAFAEGDYVLHGAWLGRVVEVIDNVTILFDDGAKCKIIEADPNRLLPISKNLTEDSSYPYYPGQRVRGVPSVVFKNARWLQGAWRPHRKEGTICDLEVGSVGVYWIAPANPGSEPGTTNVPSDMQSPKNLKLLSCFSYASWELGDWCVYPASSKTQINPSACGKKETIFRRNTEVFVSNEASPSHQCTDNAMSNAIDFVEKKSEGLDTNEASSSHKHMDDDMPNALDFAENKEPYVQPSGTATAGTKSSLNDSWVTHRKKYRKHKVKREKKQHKKGDILDRASLVVKTDTKVDVLWQDNTMSYSIDANSLFRVANLGEHDFWPDQYVIEKGSDADAEGFESKREGVVKSVNAKERTALVKWLKPTLHPDDPKEFEFDKEEVVSVYELIEHPHYNYCIGDIVVRLSPATEIPNSCDSFEQGLKNNQCEHDLKTERDCKIDNEARPDKHCEAVESRDDTYTRTDPYTEQRPSRRRQKSKLGSAIESQSSDVNEQKTTEPIYLQGSSRRRKVKTGLSISQSDLSSIGNIIGFKDGAIEVLWADGSSSKVGPQMIFVVGRDDDVESMPSHFSDDNEDEGDDDAASWETVDDIGSDMLDNENEQQEDVVETTKHCNTEGLGVEANDNVNESLSLSRAAFGFVARLAAGLLSFRSSKSSLSTSEENAEKQEPNASAIERNNVEFNQLSRDDDSFTSRDIVDKDDPKFFKHFDSVKDAQDHYYVNEAAQNFNDRKWLKKVQQEWNLLEKNLPGTIYVRVYEDRMDLLRAVIVGASGTPYQDGLYFFDLQLPADYPQAPPTVYFHSHGLRVNPNLYENGKVCLSLLNTWTGKGNEVWDPKNSTVLQVLISIQGLVLNAKPYFNEAGFDRQVGSAEGEKNSLAYNENSFLLSCRLMLYQLHKSPQHFEAFVRGHFRCRRESILSTCEAYMKGAEVGSVPTQPTVLDSASHSSAGFRLMLAKIIPKLQTAFNEL